MPTHDLVIANGTGAAVRSDLNDALAAIVSNSSNATAPATTYSYQWWADTTTGLLKIRNAANNAWVTVGTLSATNLGLAGLASPTFTGTVTSPTFTATTSVGIPLGSAGSPALFFTGDSDNGLFSPGADIFAFATNGIERLRFAASGQLGIGGANYGTSGQVLTSNGSSSAPAWQSIGSFPAGTAMLFVQTSAPTGWTKSTTHDNKALRVVSGSASSGGTTAFTSVFASRTPSGSIGNTTDTGTVGSTTLSTSQIPSHAHTQQYYVPGGGLGTGANVVGGQGMSPTVSAWFNNLTTANAGSGGSHNHSLTMNAHNHTFTGTAMDFAVQYVDVIIATKD